MSKYPLHDAAANGDLEEIKRLVEVEGMDVDQKRVRKVTELLDCYGGIYNHHIKFLIYTPLSDAVRYNKSEAIKLLAKLGGNINHICDKETGETFLHLASYNGNIESIDALVELGCNIKKLSKDRMDCIDSTFDCGINKNRLPTLTKLIEDYHLEPRLQKMDSYLILSKDIETKDYILESFVSIKAENAAKLFHHLVKNVEWVNRHYTPEQFNAKYFFQIAGIFKGNDVDNHPLKDSPLGKLPYELLQYICSMVDVRDLNHQKKLRIQDMPDGETASTMLPSLTEHANNLKMFNAANSACDLGSGLVGEINLFNSSNGHCVSIQAPTSVSIPSITTNGHDLNITVTRGSTLIIEDGVEGALGDIILEDGATLKMPFYVEYENLTIGDGAEVIIYPDSDIFG